MDFKIDTQHPETLIFDLVLVVFGVVYGVMYFVGKARNKRLALDWLHNNHSVFEPEFYAIGVDGKQLLYDGPKNYLYYCTGRDYCQHMSINIQLKSRHDIISLLALDRLFNIEHTVDSVVYTVQLDDDLVDSMCFSIVSKGISKLFLESRWDIAKFTKKIDKFLKDGFDIRSDTTEIISKLLESGIKNDVVDCLDESLIQEISFSDLPQFEPEELKAPEDIEGKPKILKIRCALHGDAKVQQKLSNLVLSFLDFMAINGKLSAKSRQGIHAIRTDFFTAIIKQQQQDRLKVFEFD